MRTPSFRPWFECLEERTNPGVVTASFAAGTLTLTGSSGADSIAISQPSFGVLQLVGDGTTPIRIGATGPTVAAGTPVTFGSAAAPVKNLNASMGIGNDTFTFNNAAAITLAGNVTVDLGSGNNQVTTTTTAAGSPTVNVGGSASFKAGSGTDLIVFLPFNVGGSLSINAGDGNGQQVVLGSQGVANATVGGALNVTTGVGNEVILLLGTDVGGLTTISTGTGNVVAGVNAIVQVFDTAGLPMTLQGGLRITDSPFDTGINQIILTSNGGAAGITIGGAGLGITTGGGIDVVVMVGQISVTAGTSLATGAGNDIVQLAGSGTGNLTFAGPFVANTGGGDDVFFVDGNGGEVDFLNSVSVNLGAGNDQLLLANGGPVGFMAGFLAVFDGGAGFNQAGTNAANILGPLPQLRNFF